VLRWLIVRGGFFVYVQFICNARGGLNDFVVGAKQDKVLVCAIDLNARNKPTEKAKQAA